ncbi:MAG: PQQ-binding-like beta-propeller repeat protein [Planctomycetaceae bacterium]|nr:PQQ-binding-like beta-propeller repeat protein [Planctomycetaceae bacterium]
MPHSFVYATMLLSPLLISTSQLSADDWPMWRHDAGRVAHSAEKLPTDLQLLWTRQLPVLKPAYRNSRLQFDAGYEPVVAGKTMFVGSSGNDRLTAYSTETGAELWRYYAEGPIRFAPVVWQEKVYFGSDDGNMYCVDAAQGKLLWKFRAAPSDRQLIGNERLISVWAVRGGPVISEGKLYFAAGVWSFEGVFIYSLDATTGKRIWLNDHTGYIYGQHPHNATAFGGITPQGYLVISGDDLIVPCGAALPATFDKNTGRLKDFNLPKDGRVPGGWFTADAKARRRGQEVSSDTKIVFDSDVNSDRHEDDQRHGPGASGIQSTVVVGDREFKYEEKIPGIEGDIHSIISADAKLFVVTKQGTISCLGKSTGKVIEYKLPVVDVQPTREIEYPISALINEITEMKGYALLLGDHDDSAIDDFLDITELKLIAVKLNPSEKQRRSLDNRGLYGTRINIINADPVTFEFPPYLANLILCDAETVPEGEAGQKFMKQIFQTLRPYGGKAYFPINKAGPKSGYFLLDQFQPPQSKGASLDVINPLLAVLTRTGALPGSSNYTGGWNSPDELVRAPLGVLWYGDEVGNFKRAPQPDIVDGMMITYDKDWKGYPDGDRPPYNLKPPVFSDIYTGRKMTAEEVKAKGTYYPKRDITQKQLSQYRPPTQKSDWSPKAPVVGKRINPMTGKQEPRAIVKSYGCDGGVDYGLMFTVRSGTAAFYDKRTESGTIHISGPRSGCTNSIIPANGLLNIPYYYQGCTCSYPLPVGLSMYSLPEQHEQWTVWGETEPKQIQRLGINFGAPGDRVTNGGTLWLDHPIQGGPSPKLDLQISPAETNTYYHHSLWVRGGQGWPWVAASGIQGASSIQLKNLKPGSYTVRLYFAEPENLKEGDRLFDVSLQGKKVLEQFDIAKQAGGVMRSVVKEFSNVSSTGEIQLSLQAIKGEVIISGIELIEVSLPTEAIIKLEDRHPERQLLSR